MTSALILVLVSGGGLVGTVVGSVVSIRLLKPQRAKLIAEARSIDRRDEQAMLDRYAKIVADQDAQLEERDALLAACHDRIDQLEVRERECEERAAALARRVDDLEDVLMRHGINGVA